MIPITYLSKMGKYDIAIPGAPTLKVRVTDHPDIGISELRSQLPGNRCLIIQLSHSTLLYKCDGLKLRCVGLSQLAAKVFKKPSLFGEKELKTLAAEVSLSNQWDENETKHVSVIWAATSFSQE
ncbi:hypothetical protein LguiA_008237 [Lonicera macranthoides]